LHEENGALTYTSVSRYVYTIHAHGKNQTMITQREQSQLPNLIVTIHKKKTIQTIVKFKQTMIKNPKRQHI